MPYASEQDENQMQYLRSMLSERECERTIPDFKMKLVYVPPALYGQIFELFFSFFLFWNIKINFEADDGWYFVYKTNGVFKRKKKEKYSMQCP